MSNAPAKRANEVRRTGRAPAEPVLTVLGNDRKSEEHRALSGLRAVTLAAITPLLEKNAIKTVAVDVPLVFSMSRIVVLAFATGMVRQLWKAGIASWPEATVTMTIVLALPMLGALERTQHRERQHDGHGDGRFGPARDSGLPQLPDHPGGKREHHDPAHGEHQRNVDREGLDGILLEQGRDGRESHSAQT